MVDRRACQTLEAATESRRSPQGYNGNVATTPQSPKSPHPPTPSPCAASRLLASTQSRIAAVSHTQPEYDAHERLGHQTGLHDTAMMPPRCIRPYSHSMSFQASSTPHRRRLSIPFVAQARLRLTLSPPCTPAASPKSISRMALVDVQTAAVRWQWILESHRVQSTEHESVNHVSPAPAFASPAKLMRER